MITKVLVSIVVYFLGFFVGRATIARKSKKTVEHQRYNNSAEALRLRGDPKPFPSRWAIKDGDKKRIVAWDAAMPQVNGEQKLVGAALNVLHAEGVDLSDADPLKLEQHALHAVLWWHGVKESDLPDDV